MKKLKPETETLLRECRGCDATKPAATAACSRDMSVAVAAAMEGVWRLRNLYDELAHAGEAQEVIGQVHEIEAKCAGIEHHANAARKHWRMFRNGQRELQELVDRLETELGKDYDVGVL